MNCIIIEDQLPAQRVLEKYISDIGSMNLIGCYADAMESLEVINSGKVDVVFLDIHLPKISGMDFLKSLTSSPSVIITTAFQDYAIESYEYNVVDYLLKPFSFQRFVKAVSKANKKQPNLGGASPVVSQETEVLDEIFVKVGYDFVRVRFDEIFYILTDSDYTELYFKDKKVLSSESLKYWQGVLDEKKFMRIHKSYMVNISKIVKVSGNKIYLEENKTIPLGRAYKNDFLKLFKKIT
ncbi:LytR/AlgR family response regulator transcription factor [Flavicella marina]|uniref:LytR/AlgR family response regulator transcription factor n=1 Tax=Flavicella marina TaxID=1475951 RepID=UPI00126409FA|nr:LytTR family DNA-binding domain-containing protein [Flavicella marina]